MYDEFMQEIADFIVEAKLAVKVRGCTDEAIQQLETQLIKKFPASYKAYLRKMGEYALNWNDYDMDFTVRDLIEAHDTLDYFNSYSPSTWQPTDAILPFSQRIGDVVLFLQGTGDDPAVYYCMEGDESPTKIGVAFSAWWREEILQHLELRRLQRGHNMGGTPKDAIWQIDRQTKQFRHELIEKIHLTDQQRSRLTPPKEFQEIWMQVFAETDLYQEYKTLGKSIPYWWIK